MSNLDNAKNRFLITHSEFMNKREDTVVSNQTLEEFVKDIQFAEEDNRFVIYNTVECVNIAIRPRNIESVAEIPNEVEE